MKLILIVFLLMIIFSLNAVAIQKSDIQKAANFYSDYIDFFNKPPKYVVVNKSAVDISAAYLLFTQYIAGKSDFDIHPIKGENHNFITNNECALKTGDIKEASQKLLRFFEVKNEFPLAIKINDCYISNSDFLYLISRMIRDEFMNNKFNEDYTIMRLYFDKTINWNSVIYAKKRYIGFTMDYEADRPENSDYYINSIDVATENVSTIGINPRLFNRLCYGNFCTLPEDYGVRDYSSAEIAWTTAIKENGEIVYPPCYPYCGATEGTYILFKEFIDRYGFPVVWHMTGNSIIAIASKPELISKVLEYKNNGLIDLGLHTMYHTNIKKVPYDFREKTIREGYEIFKYAFNDNPVQFRAPYLDLPENYLPDYYLLDYGLLADNEVPDVYSDCNLDASCNYEIIPNSSMSFVRLDWQINQEDSFLNIYLSHPWELLYETEGNPIYLKESGNAKFNAFKKWLYPVGELGLIPTTPTEFLGGKPYE